MTDEVGGHLEQGDAFVVMVASVFGHLPLALWVLKSGRLYPLHEIAGIAINVCKNHPERCHPQDDSLILGEITPDLWAIAGLIAYLRRILRRMPLSYANIIFYQKKLFLYQENQNQGGPNADIEPSETNLW